MPGSGPLRRSSGPARKRSGGRRMAKSRVEANRLQRPASVFLAVVISGCMFSDLHGKESLTKANGKLGGCQFPCNRGVLPFFGEVAQYQINEFSGCLNHRESALWF